MYILYLTQNFKILDSCFTRYMAWHELRGVKRHDSLSNPTCNVPAVLFQILLEPTHFAQ